LFQVTRVVRNTEWIKVLSQNVLTRIETKHVDKPPCILQSEESTVYFVCGRFTLYL